MGNLGVAGYTSIMPIDRVEKILKNGGLRTDVFEVPLSDLGGSFAETLAHRQKMVIKLGAELKPRVLTKTRRRSKIRPVASKTRSLTVTTAKGR
jgi:hypothetical protein